MTIGWGIIGIGAHANRVMAPAINAASDSRLVAAASRDLARADDFACHHKAEAGYASLEAMLEHPGLDVVYIASPNHLHAHHAVAAARAGKHVLCEKPMALTVADCQAMVAECQRHSVLLGLGFHMRHHPAHQEARRLVQEGALGDVVLAQAFRGAGRRGRGRMPTATGLKSWWSVPEQVGAGALMAMGVHLIDLLRFVLNQEVVAVTAMSDGQRPQYPLDDYFALLLEFDGGSFGQATVSRRIPDARNDLVVCGSTGRIVGADTISPPMCGRLEVVSDAVNVTQDFGEGSMYVNMVNAFNACVREGRQPGASGMDGLRVAEVTVAALESVREGRTVRVRTSGERAG